MGIYTHMNIHVYMVCKSSITTQPTKNMDPNFANCCYPVKSKTCNSFLSPIYTVI